MEAKVDGGESLIAGAEVAITGRLASMRREDAIRCIEVAGGRYVEAPGPKTDLLIVGLEGWPQSRGGRMTKSLADAEQLEASGSAITITSEEDFLVSLGLQEHSVGLHQLHTTEQLARMLDMPASLIQSWVRHGLLEPVRVVGRLYWFDFPQIASMRALRRLQQAGASVMRIRRCRDLLRGRLPGEEIPLTRLEVDEEAGELLLRLEDGRVCEPSGQLRLDFAPPPAPSVPVAGALRLVHADPETADSWFDQGVEAEAAEQLEDAVSCYMNALLAGGPQAETCFNLGNALFGLERFGEAMQRFLQAIELDPEYVEAWNNLGNALSHLDRQEEAVNAYEQAIEIEPLYADAYCNLAESLEQLGRHKEAIQNFKEYLKRDPNSAWARKIRDRIDRG